MATSKSLKNLALVLTVLVLGAGIGSGFLLSKVVFSSSKVLGDKTAPSVTTNSNRETGLSDTTAFTDTAQGTLQEGGISGEGTHKLIRPGGDSQNVYLTSTVIDLSSYAGKNVQVWGQTIAAKKAGWLMDVGKIKILE